MFLDLSKAFDTVDHQLLIHKLKFFKFKSSLIKLIENYLTDRSIRVNINNTLSKKKSITVGVPQGSVLGPLLFIMYTNDMSLLKLHSSSWLFADDTTIALDGTSIIDIINKIQEDLAKIIEWLNSNKLLINLKKSQIMHLPSTCTSKKILHLPSTCKTHCNIDPVSKKKIKDDKGKDLKCKKPLESITFNGEKVFFIEHAKILGVTIDNQLKFDNHIKEICKKVNSKTALLKKSNYLFPKKFKVNLFKLFIMPHYDYCCSLFAKQSSQLNQHRLISNFNKSILRFLKINLYGLTLEEQYTKLKSLKLNILPILFRLFTHLCLFFYSSSMIKNIDLNNEITDRINNRNSKFFYKIPNHNGTKFSISSFLYISTNVFN